MDPVPSLLCGLCFLFSNRADCHANRRRIREVALVASVRATREAESARDFEIGRVES